MRIVLASSESALAWRSSPANGTQLKAMPCVSTSQFVCAFTELVTSATPTLVPPRNAPVASTFVANCAPATQPSVMRQKNKRPASVALFTSRNRRKTHPSLPTGTFPPSQWFLQSRRRRVARYWSIRNPDSVAAAIAANATSSYCRVTRLALVVVTHDAQTARETRTYSHSCQELSDDKQV